MRNIISWVTTTEEDTIGELTHKTNRLHSYMFLVVRKAKGGNALKLLA